MTDLNDRKDAFEKKFAHEAQQNFALEARMSKIYGLWCAEQLGFSGPEADSYAMDVVEANLEEPGFEDILRKVRKDFGDKDLDISEHVMIVELEKAMDEAKRQLEDEAA